MTYPDAKTVGYAYDDASNLTTLTYPDSYAVTYTYDDLDRLDQVLANGTTLLAEYEYDALSRRALLTYGNGATTSYTYEDDDDLAVLSHAFTGSAVSFTYSYDRISNRTGTQVSDDRFLWVPSVNQTIGYAPNSLNQYASVDSVTFNYDDNGNLTSDGVNTYTYDSENRLTGATVPGHTDISYSYDALGRRSSKTVDGETTSFLYNGDQVLMEYDGSGQLLRRFIYGAGIDEPICLITVAGAKYYDHFDGIGSVIALTDETGNEAEIYTYSPFGEVNQASSVGNPYLFTGRRYDPETGLYYYRARYYDAGLGRFMQVDPTGYADSMNLYLYALNNPLSFIDPFGLASEGGQSYLSRSLNQVILGNYTNNVTLLGTAGQMALGVIGADLPADMRDLWYDVTHWENSWEHAGQTLLDATTVFPLVGMAKYSDEIGSLAKSAAKKALPDFPTRNTKNWSANFASEGEARVLARGKLGKILLRLNLES